MRHPVQQQILAELAKGPADAAQLANALGKDPCTIRVHWHELAKAGLLRLHREQRERGKATLGGWAHNQRVMVAELIAAKQ